MMHRDHGCTQSGSLVYNHCSQAPVLARVFTKFYWMENTTVESNVKKIDEAAQTIGKILRGKHDILHKMHFTAPFHPSLAFVLLSYMLI